MGEGKAPPMDVETVSSSEDSLVHDRKSADHKSAMKHSSSLASLGSNGLRITFQNIDYTVINSQNKKERINLLNDVSGFFNPGQMSALMGPSGSGKTTLLDVLAGRKTTGKISGEILFSGVPPSQTFLRRFTGYVEQFDTLLDTLTVREMLLYTAELKCSHREPREAKVQRVDDLVEKLNLARCKDVRIGSVLERGISGGQAKRVNIGIALVTSPRVLFLDEPTSGLDSYTANEVMKVVKDLVTGDITICSTIHSPTPFTFRLFDRMLILLRGEVAYFGDRGEEAIEYFQTHNPLAGSMGEGANEAEWIVDLTTQADRQGKGSELAATYAASELCRRNGADIKKFAGQTANISEESRQELKTKRATVTPFWWALLVLFKYRTLSNYRDPQFLGPRIGDKLIFSLLIMSIYWKVGKDLSSNNVINIAAVCFMWNTLPAFGAAAYVPSIVLERPLFIRERNDGLYRVITYLCAKMLDELLLAFFASIAFSLIVFYPLAMQGLWVTFWLNYLCSLSIGIVLAYFVAAMSPTMEIANAALPTYVVTQLFFAGFLIRWDDIPKYWRWATYIDFLYYGFGTLMINQFSGKDATINGQPVLEYYSLDTYSKWLFLLYEFLFFVVIFGFAFLALQFKNHQKR